MEKSIPKDTEWKKMYEFIVECGKVHDPYRFTVKIVEGLKDFLDFDDAIVLFLDGNRNIVDQYLYRFDKNWFHIFIEYYAKKNISPYFGMDVDASESEHHPRVELIDWKKIPYSDFIRDYIQENHLSESLAFVLYDLNGFARTVFSFDLKHGRHYSDHAVDIVKLLVPALNNLHKNFYVKIPGGFRHSNPLWNDAQLTERETQIVDLICQGVSPNNISKILHIATSTTYKHIAHIYEKFRVSSKQELLVKLLNTQR